MYFLVPVILIFAAFVDLEGPKFKKKIEISGVFRNILIHSISSLCVVQLGYRIFFCNFSIFILVSDIPKIIFVKFSSVECVEFSRADNESFGLSQFGKFFIWPILMNYDKYIKKIKNFLLTLILLNITKKYFYCRK